MAALSGFSKKLINKCAFLTWGASFGMATQSIHNNVPSFGKIILILGLLDFSLFAIFWNRARALDKIAAQCITTDNSPLFNCSATRLLVKRLIYGRISLISIKSSFNFFNDGFKGFSPR